MLSFTSPTLKILDIIENRTDCKGAANGEEEPVEYRVMKKPGEPISLRREKSVIFHATLK